MGAKYPYYLLADSPEGIKKESELTGKMPPEHKTEEDIRKGFVYKRVPHITLKSIANNEDLDGIYAPRQEKMEPVVNRDMKMYQLSRRGNVPPAAVQASCVVSPPPPRVCP